MLKREVGFSRHVVTAEGAKPNLTNTDKIIRWPKPNAARQPKQLIAMGSHYRRYVKDFASLIRPLDDFTKKEKQFIWTEGCLK